MTVINFWNGHCARSKKYCSRNKTPSPDLDIDLYKKWTPFEYVDLLSRFMPSWWQLFNTSEQNVVEELHHSQIPAVIPHALQAKEQFLSNGNYKLYSPIKKLYNWKHAFYKNKSDSGTSIWEFIKLLAYLYIREWKLKLPEEAVSRRVNKLNSTLHTYTWLSKLKIIQISGINKYIKHYNFLFKESEDEVYSQYHSDISVTWQLGIDVSQSSHLTTRLRNHEWRLQTRIRFLITAFCL